MSLKNRQGNTDISELRGFLAGDSGRKKSRVPRVITAFILMCLVAVVLAGVDYWANAGEIYGGVRVGSVDLGGKTPAEARAILNERVKEPLREIELKGPEDFTRSAGEMGIEFDVETAVQKAYAVGREGNIFERLYERVEAAFGAVSVPSVMSYKPDVARGEVEEIASQLDHRPGEASMSIEGSEVRVVESRDGFETDVAQTMKNLDAAVQRMSGEVEIAGKTLHPDIQTPVAEKAAEKARAAMSEPLMLSTQDQQWSFTPAQVGEMLEVDVVAADIQVTMSREKLEDNLAGIVSSLNSEPVEAGFEVQGSGVVVTPSQDGRHVESEKLLDTILGNIFEGQHQFEVPVVIEEPGLTTAEAEELKPTQLLGSYKTNYLTYDDSPGRVENLQKASNAVDGTILAPGETFSFNDLAASLDYDKTKVIINGKVQKADGGGLCQVSTTLYMAANYAGLDVIERHPHYAELPYIRPGFDATVWFGSASGGELDMKFVNNSGAYVLIREWVDTSTGNVHAEIWGRPTGREVQMSSKKVLDTPKMTKWVTYQTTTENGKVIQKGILHKDTYKPLEG